MTCGVMKNAVAMLSSRERDVVIDRLRGVSILVVLIGHFHNAYNLATNLRGLPRSLLLPLVLENEHYGVVAFFTISGYLITSNTLRRYGSFGSINALGFYLFRFARITPCLLLFVLMVAVFEAIGIPRFNLGNDNVAGYLAVASAFLFFHNVLIIHFGWFSYCLNILWSISIEEAFYFGYPLVMLALRHTRFVQAACVALILAGPLHRFFTSQHAAQYYCFLSCFDAIAFGILAAISVHAGRRDPRTARMLRIGGACILILVSIAKAEVGLTLGVSAIALGTAMILLATQPVEQLSRRSVRVVSWFGSRSYELYLFHIVVLALMRAVAGPGTIVIAWRPVWLLLFLLLAALVAAVISNGFSNPANLAIRQLFANRVRVASTV